MKGSNQEALEIATDLEIIAKATEGSMKKRQAVFDRMANKEEELREKIKKAQQDYSGRRMTHLDVSKRFGWSSTELDGVLKGDQIIFENEIMNIIKQETAKAELRGRIEENKYHWHHQRAIEEEFYVGSVSAYFIDRNNRLKEENQDE